jgi:hypothetical protein
MSTADGLLSCNNNGLVAATNSDVTSKQLEGYVSLSGPLLETDTILEALGKLNGNNSASTKSFIKCRTTGGGSTVFATSGLTQFATIGGFSTIASNDFTRTGDAITYTGGSSKYVIVDLQMNIQLSGGPATGLLYMWIEQTATATFGGNYTMVSMCAVQDLNYLSVHVTDLLLLTPPIRDPVTLAITTPGTSFQLALRLTSSQPAPYTVPHPIAAYFVHEI